MEGVYSQGVPSTRQEQDLWPRAQSSTIRFPLRPSQDPSTYEEKQKEETKKEASTDFTEVSFDDLGGKDTAVDNEGDIEEKKED